MTMTRDIPQLVSLGYANIFTLAHAIGAIFATIAFQLLMPLIAGNKPGVTFLIPMFIFPTFVSIFVHLRQPPTTEALDAQSHAENELVEQIDQMMDLMQGKIGTKDQYTLSYKPASGTHVLKNGEEVGAIEGLEFKKALFGIWLSDKPAQNSLKAGMLGG